MRFPPPVRGVVWRRRRGEFRRRVRVINRRELMRLRHNPHSSVHRLPNELFLRILNYL